MKRTLLTLAAVAILLAPAAANAKLVSKFGVNIQSCVVNQGGNGLTNGINVVFFNTKDAPIGQVQFHVRYRGHNGTFTATGTFTRGAEINKNLTDALVSYPWSGPSPEVCAVEKVVNENGNVRE